ncbi:MAG: leucine-rich repeat domain-containing protein [Bacteroides sp.]|nr:leucine-rich repeat domain-containing protein [Alistipes timonensis]MCM1311192.1 leucine-rich repeat domain-containing protein [Bacteroides sp.]MCM1405718.1 leucine-rich repeat domain-containing protein [[Clostridium] fimetarium]
MKSIEIGGWGDPFSVLSNLHTLIVKSVVPPKVTSEYWVISNATIPAESCVLYVPAGSEAAYGATNYWAHLKYTTAIGSEAPIIIDTVDGLKYAMRRADMTAALLPKGIQVEMPGVEFPPNPNEKYVEGSVSIPPTVDYGGVSYKVTSLAKYAFSRCSTVDQVIVPEGVTQIDKYAFEYSNIKSVSLPASLKEIGDRAFASCVKLTELVIPGTETIGNDVFNGCDNLEELTFENGTTAIGDIYLQLPSTIKIKQLRFPNTLKRLGRIQVGYIDLEEIILPPSLEEIEYLSLSKDGLKIYSLNPIPPAIVDSPYGRSLLYVPESAVEVYKNSSKWKHLSREILPIVNDLTVSATDGGNVAVNGVLLPSRRSSFDGEEFNIKFFPDANFTVESVSLNGKDISSDIENRELSLAGLSMQNKLEITFAECPVATLCVKGADSHSTVHTYAEGTEARIELRPEDGWSVHALLYNNEDATAELVDNVLVTKPLYGDNQLNVVMAKDGLTDVNGVTFAKRRIYVISNGDTAEIVNLDDDEEISVYGASGELVYQGSDHSVQLRHNEVYILMTARETLKFAF